MKAAFELKVIVTADVLNFVSFLRMFHTHSVFFLISHGSVVNVFYVMIMLMVMVMNVMMTMMIVMMMTRRRMRDEGDCDNNDDDAEDGPEIEDGFGPSLDYGRPRRLLLQPKSDGSINV